MGQVKFGDVVKEVKINIDRTNNPYDYYVAGDHMDSEDLTIRRKGAFATDDVGPAFTRLFKPGQILYGSRRTYLKKVAVADFEGICSNTTFVLETKDERILRQRLLPFIMLTDDFTKWSISKSKGSTNPYILFSDLANYEFELPDIARQDELVELLWQAYATKESYKNMILAIDEMVKSQFIEMTKATKSIKLEDVAKEIFAGGDKPKDYSAVQNGQYQYPVFSNGIGDNALLCFSKECRVKESAITVSARGTIGHAESREAGFTPVVRLLTLIPKDGYQLAYLKFALNSITFHSTGSSQGQLTAPDFSKYEIPDAPKDVQLAFESIVHHADKSKFELKQAIEKIDKVMRALMQ